MELDSEIRDAIDVAHEIAVATKPKKMAVELQGLLGQKLVAFAVGDRHPKTIGRYARGERAPTDASLGRLTDLYTVVLILERGRAERGSWIKQWMLGSNMRLGGQAPAQVFHDGEASKVMGAARYFISGR